MADSADLMLKNLWYLALPADAVPQGKLVHRQIAYHRIVFGRDKDGKPYALRDNCPHRGVPLSTGRVLDNGCIQCCYHGWEFDSQGVCRNIPALPPTSKADISKIKAYAFPVAEINGTIWIYIPEKLTPNPEVKEPLPDFHLASDLKLLHVESIVMPTNIDHSVIGLIDPAHVTFVHQSWFWRSAKSLKLKTKNFEPTARGFKMVKHAPSANSKGYKVLQGDVSTEIFFDIPGNRLEHIAVGTRHKVISLTTLTPIDDHHTELNQFFYSTLAITRLLWWPLKTFGKTFIGQDVGVFNKLARGLENDPPLMLVGEPDAQARWYYDLKKEWKSAQASGTEFKNPLQAETLQWVT
ncbi:MAG: aromatic ring-hydroxylating dioxygenase subunit alpha [Cyclobacteriaceae bacterium]|jgi:phenylpropionate dioxygenase-like ring-hydroxylating dioxygenase large terminal subunit|nr:2Fe-2S ferredoxin [Cytophagales bacterium]HNP78841.1 aromatic ring-hydroxylating dioxygenase subunit alpha [Cyclobacteriaceae bacterium]